uniref:Uncharacterized protein n=1 Tax=Anguilla anguilla TaxID=7936 RepID=A0A0E9QMS3_ANGAN
MCTVSELHRCKLLYLMWALTKPCSVDQAQISTVTAMAYQQAFLNVSACLFIFIYFL